MKGLYQNFTDSNISPDPFVENDITHVKPEQGRGFSATKYTKLLIQISIFQLMITLSKVLQSLKDVERSARSVENKYKKLLSQYDDNIPVRSESYAKLIASVSHVQNSAKH